MAKSNKLQQLLDQKAKIEEQLRIEKEKQYLLIGKIAVKYDLHTWSKEEIENLFKEASEKGQLHYANKTTDQETQQKENAYNQHNQNTQS